MVAPMLTVAVKQTWLALKVWPDGDRWKAALRIALPAAAIVALAGWLGGWLVCLVGALYHADGAVTWAAAKQPSDGRLALWYALCLATTVAAVAARVAARRQAQAGKGA